MVLMGMYYELLEVNEIITEERHRKQLMQLCRLLKKNRLKYAKRHSHRLTFPHESGWAYIANVGSTEVECVDNSAVFMRFWSLQFTTISIKE